MVENLGYGQNKLKGNVLKEAEKEEKPAVVKEEEEQWQGPAMTGNWKSSNITMITAKNTLSIDMRVKVIYSFKSVIYRGGGEIQPYSETLDSSPGMFTSLKEIQAYIEECEQKWLDLDNEEVWSNVYLPQEQPRFESIIQAKLCLSMFK